jgi:hypothetical protein
MAARDGGCINCGASVTLTQAHHVDGWKPDHDGDDHGPSNIDNGVLLCWRCHREADAGRLPVRMNRGVPEIHHPTLGWILGKQSRMRMLDRFDHPPGGNPPVANPSGDYPPGSE